MLRCGAADAAQCLQDHIRPHLTGPKDAPKGYRALAPCHTDAEPSLSLTAAEGRVIWNCFSCKQRFGNEEAQKRTRNALLRAGVPSRCLPQARADAEDEIQAVLGIGTGKDSHAHKLLRIVALLNGWEQLPAGDALEALAESCGVSTREAYRARRQGLEP